MSSLSFEGDDQDIGYESVPYDVSKSLHVAEEEMQVAPPETELPSKGLLLPKVSFIFHLCLFPIENIDNILIICLSNLLQGLPLQLKVKPLQISL